MSWWILNPCVPGSNLGNRKIFFFFFLIFSFIYFFIFFCHYYYSANLQIQHYCLFSVSPTLLLLEWGGTDNLPHFFLLNREHLNRFFGRKSLIQGSRFDPMLFRSFR